MTESKTFAAGTPSWADLTTPDLDKSTEFYGTLLDWDIHKGDEETGGYSMINHDDKLVGGVGPLPFEAAPSNWSVYFTVDNVDDTVKRAVEAGGKALMEPMDVFDAGRLCFVSDPGGASFGLWQKNELAGADAWGDRHAASWVELNTRDTAQATKFYSKLFGWDAKPGENYSEFGFGDTSFAGMLDMNFAQIPTEVPSHWLIYFNVDDVDKSLARAGEIGGGTIVPPMDIPNDGRFAIVKDATGAIFGLLKHP